MEYTKIAYADGSGEPLSAANLNHAESGIEAASLRTGAFWAGSVSVTANTPYSSDVTFSGTKSYIDDGSATLFNYSSYSGLLIPANKLAAVITARLYVNNPSSGTTLQINHHRGATTTTIGEHKIVDAIYSMSTSAFYPVEEDDYITVHVAGLTAYNQSVYVELSVIVL